MQQWETQQTICQTLVLRGDLWGNGEAEVQQMLLGFVAKMNQGSQTSCGVETETCKLQPDEEWESHCGTQTKKLS